MISDGLGRMLKLIEWVWLCEGVLVWLFDHVWRCSDLFVGIDFLIVFFFLDVGVYFFGWVHSLVDVRVLWLLIDVICVDDLYLEVGSFVDHF